MGAKGLTVKSRRFENTDIGLGTRQKLRSSPPSRQDVASGRRRYFSV